MALLGELVGLPHPDRLASYRRRAGHQQFPNNISLGCAVVTLAMGVVTCLAYMFIDVERYEVERAQRPSTIR